jgi:hypothetical protein
MIETLEEVIYVSSYQETASKPCAKLTADANKYHCPNSPISKIDRWCEVFVLAGSRNFGRPTDDGPTR